MRIKTGMIGVVGIMAVGVASAAFVPYEDFEGYAADLKLADNGSVTKDGWKKTTDANARSSETFVRQEVSGNKYLLHKKTGAAGGWGTVAQSGTGFFATTNPSDGFQTLFFRLKIDTSLGTDGTAGLGFAANIGTANPTIKTGFRIDGSGNVMNKVGTVAGSPVALDQWYNAWLLVDHRGTGLGRSVELYLQRNGDANYATQSMVGNIFYNNPGAAAYDDFLIGADRFSTGVQMAVDDLWYDNNTPAGNLISPIPEPATLSMIGLASGLLLAVRRFRM